MIQLLHNLVSSHFSCAHVSLGDPTGDRVVLKFVVNMFRDSEETLHVDIVGVSRIGEAQGIDFACTAKYKSRTFETSTNSLNNIFKWVEATLDYINKWCRY